MKNLYVDGSDNGKFYDLAEGTIKIRGTISSTKQDNNYGGDTLNPMTIEVYRNRLGPDKFIGSIEVGRSSYITIKDQKIGTADYDCADYYIVAFKANKDYWTATGTGVIHN